MLNRIITNGNGGTAVPNLAEQAFLRWLKADDAAQQADYKLYRQYYNGVHNVPLTQRQEDYLQRNGVLFRFNFLQLPVKVLAQRLQVDGFDAPAPYGGETGDLWEWWNFNRMDAQQKAVHRSAMVDGDSYVLVEWDEAAGMPRFFHEPAYDGSEGVKVTYTTSGRREIAFASKRWREVDANTGKTWRRLNVYTPDAVYKYRTSSDTDAGWAKYQDEGDPTWPLDWPVGVVPVVHFRHDDDGGNWGRSELDDLIPVQNALNKAVIDLLEGADKTAFQLITLSGAKAEGLEVGARQVLYTSVQNASWGYIPAGDISKLIDLKNDFIVTLAQMSQVPLSYFQVTGQVASAETQKADDTGLVAKAEDTAVSFGNSWEDVMRMAIRLQAAFGGGGNQPDDISTLWRPFERIDKLVTEKARSEIVSNLVQAGATIEGAVTVAGYNAEDTALLVRGDMVDGIEQGSSLINDTGLNGAQIRAALDLMAAVSSGETSELVGVELLISLGIAREVAQEMIASAIREGVAAASLEGAKNAQ